MTKRMIIMLAGVSLLFGGIFGVKAFSAKMMNQFFDNMPVPPATITATEVRAMNWADQMDAVGSIVPVNGTDVTTEAAGIVQAIYFESGQRVEAGARLITLDAANELAELKKLEAQAELAELNRQRREKILALKAIAESDYDAAVSEAKASKAAADAQRAKVAQKDIRAPFSGLLGIRQVNIGQYLSPGTAIVGLQSLNPINVDFALPEQALGAVRPGLKVAVEVEAYPGERFFGELVAIEPRVDPKTRTFTMRARLPNPQQKLRSGLFARVQILLPGESNVIAVPRTAISYNPYGNAVFVIEKAPQKTAPAPEGGIAANAQSAAGSGSQLVVRQRFVKTGRARGDFLEILEGLKPGEQIATSGLLKLRNDQPVMINNAIQPDVNMAPKVSDS